MKRKYHIGELAAYYGVSSDTLRLYDKKGILSPKKDVNGYRVYSREDMIFLDYVIRLRRLGIPLKEIKKLVDEGSFERAEQVLAQRSMALLAHIEELRSLYRVTQDYVDTFRRTSDDIDKFTVCLSPRMIVREITNSFIGASAAFDKLGANIVPRFCMLCNKEAFLAEGYEHNVYDYERRCSALKNAVVVMDRDGIVAVPERYAEEFRILPPQKCVYTAVRCHAVVDYEPFVRLRRFILENGFVMSGDMITVIISVRNGGSKNEDYEQVWIPVQ